MYFLILISCSAKRQSGGQLVTYEEYLKQLSDIKKDYSRKGLKEKKELLFKIISEEMPDYWIGTKWDFNGTTRTPGDGEIACGYFVTTVLFDAGFEIERVKLAQQVSSVMIEKLTVNIKRTGNIETLKEYISGQPDHSVFIIGLDFHTGFITRDGSNFYFIHSNYIRKKGVQKELIDFSSALKASKSFMIGNLSENEKLVESWCK
ncbi:MAG: hypothetical protein A2W91_05975 [Bacteroidetes bacterium GWF2_38_335]|nr:MAG: hypothetical protein A2W91_05975 [Bacteroidetes bacterium GWF2_38_335]OFY81622.1 MAG: hypothetical protein A2281_11770 [Bacteroidetes bacterium RIFOXYA12_FULL_38_20]HBS88974.1 hypothetical protein [Bacteroidales bacterium]